jgi:hypothetical protein
VGKVEIDSVVVVNPESVFSDVGGATVILNPADGKYYGLNPLAADIWRLIQTPISVSAVCDSVQKEYDVERATCERDLLDVLNHMQAHGLILVE